MKNNNENQYLQALKTIKDFGLYEPDRTGVGTFRYPGIQMRFDLTEGFPILTTKKVLFYPLVIELLWFLQGNNKVEWLQERSCNIWNAWQKDDGTIGPGYGKQWRRWPYGAVHHVDQIAKVIKDIKTNPTSRRLIVSAWNVSQLEEMALPPCHFSFQFIVIDGTLNTVLYQRSADLFLGVPFNIASYALLTELVAIECNLKVGSLIHNIGDAHIYSNHVDQVNLQLTRKPFGQPKLILSEKIFENGLLKWIDKKSSHLSLEEIKNLIQLDNYQHADFIKAEVAV